MNNRISIRLQEKIRRLVEQNQLEEAYQLAGKIFHGDAEIINQISMQIGRLRNAISADHLSSEMKSIEVNRIRKALFDLLETYADDFPALNCDYAEAIALNEQIHFASPTEENPILIGFLIDFSTSMYGNAKNISPFLDTLEVSLNELVNSSADTLQKTDKSISSKIEIFMTGCGMINPIDKAMSFFKPDISEDSSVKNLLEHETMPVDAVLRERNNIEERIRELPKGSLRNDIAKGFSFVQQLIQRRNLPSGSLKILFTVSDSKWGNQSRDVEQIATMLKAENVIIVNGLMAKQRIVPYKYLPTSVNNTFSAIFNAASLLPHHTEIYDALYELGWEFTPMESKMLIQVNDYSTMYEAMMAIINAVSNNNG